MNGRKIGVLTGTFHDKIAEEQIDNAQISYYQNITELVLALRTGKVESIIFEWINALRYMKMYPELRILGKMIPNVSQAIGFKKGHPLKAEVDSILQELNQQDFYNKQVDRWIADEETPIPPQDWAGKNGTIIVGTTGTMPPTTFFLNGEIAGAEIALVHAIAKTLDKKVQTIAMDFNALIPALQSGKVDMCIAGIVITEERKQSIDFTIPYFNSAIVAMVRANGQTVAPASSNFFREMQESFHRTFVTEARWKMVADGLGVTLLISVLSGFFGLLLGFIICMFRRSRNTPSAFLSAVFIRLIQGMPVLVLLMILYYIVFGHSNLNGIVVAIIAFATNFGVYASEIIRSGMDAVDPGQIEAAAALGFNPRQCFTKILLPQAASHFIPVLKGEFISMVKMTSIVGYIAVMDLTKVSDIIRSRTMEAFFPLIATAILYFLIANLLTYTLTLVERSIDPKRRPRKIKGVHPND